jgi:hypothetical protein
VNKAILMVNPVGTQGKFLNDSYRHI